MKRSSLIATWLLLIAALLIAFTFRASALTTCNIFTGCTGTSTAPTYGQLLIGGRNGEYEYVASSTLGGVGFSTSSAAFWLTQQSTSNLPEGSNLYFTNARAVSALTGQSNSIFTNGAGYLTSLAGAASSTLLIDSNSFGGSNTFTQTLNLNPVSGTAILSQDTALSTTTVASTTGIFLQNTTAAINNGQQSSPALTLEGQGWGTTAPASALVDWTEYLLPVQGTVPTANLIWASSVSGAPFTTRATLTSGGIYEPTNLEVAAGALGSTNTTNGAFWMPAAITISHQTVGQYTFATSSSNGVGMRVGFYGLTGTVLTVGDNYAAVVMGGTPVTTAASGVQNWLTTLALKPPFVIGAGAAHVSNAATLFIDSAPTSTVDGLDYDLYASSTGADYFGGKVGIGTTTPTGSLSVGGASFGTTNGVCHQEKAAGLASSYDWFYYVAGSATPVYQSTSCSGVRYHDHNR